MSEKTYKIRDDIAPEQIAAAIDALNPFYAFGAVLEVANEEKGTASVCLYAGTDRDELHEDAIASYEGIENKGAIVGISGAWDRVPAVYCGPILRAEDFFAARDAFMACIESTRESDGSPQGGDAS